MIKTPTAFVLGAGGSVDYGFPVGWKLLQTICTIAANRSYVQYFSKDYNGIHFAEHLEKSAKLSIDAFLEHRADLLEFGKTLIAIALIPCEDERRLFTTRHQPAGWYRYLFDKMNCGYDNFSDNQVKFITYNYDRSLEHFLTNALASLYNKPLNETCKVVQNIEIIHVHGALGDYAIGPHGPSVGRHYTPEINNDAIRTVIAGIKVIHESSQDSPELKRAIEILQWAKRIYFIGFGYNSTAMERLRPQDWVTNEKKIHGTAFGMTQSERTQTLTRLAKHLPDHIFPYVLRSEHTGNTGFKPGHMQISLDDGDIQASDFIRRMPDLTD